MKPVVSIIMPCRNEGPFIELAIHDALAQERGEFELEVLVAVGPSTDDTHAKVLALSKSHAEVHLIENPAGVVPHGLNAAIRGSKGKYIVRLDAHSRYPNNYVTTLIDALERLNAENVGGVWDTLPANDSNKAWAIAQVLSSSLGVGNAHFRTGTDAEREVDTVPYGCFRRELFDRIGFFDEELFRNQDDEHNGRIIKHGGTIFLLPQIHIKYYTRDTIAKLWRMYREYGLFKPLVNLKLGAPATFRQFVPPLFVAALVLLPFLAFVNVQLIWFWVGLIVVYFSVLKLTSIRIAWRGDRLGAYVWMVIAFFTVHVAYGVGYWQGIFKFLLFRRKLDPSTIRTNR
ncbi:MAG: glycosyltransferase family 2 protein [Flavobacteriales bacterium]|nr:glycosyltransferase family 2 protein [Flavobacteriales bacterium]MBK6945287.1 glycosyltransferase family 2 protein [Flavobacteriales bacterium]MBK9535158.1 glycosyltransferase family 2 protein [Flavobacteriales bacterium]MBP9137867.1 glycosyltransferase family 2 protein [Flavobacteriales bacterium]HQV51497.1 glycosyltransferase family 2 protein [Flavobacteriales bacterium]